MSEIIKQKLISIAEAIHLRIFGHEMSPMMRDFLGHLSWSFFGIMCSSILFFFGVVLIGRSLGPFEYGKYNLVISISNIAVVFIFLGFDTTAVRFISHTDDHEKQNGYLSNSFWFVVFSSIFILIISFIFKNTLSSILNTDSKLILIAFLFSFFTAFKLLFDSFIKALHNFKYQSITKIIESSLFLLLIVYLFFCKYPHNYFYFLIPSVIGFMWVIFSYGKIIVNRIGRWNKKLFLNSKPYWKLTAGVSLICIIIGTADKLLVAKYLGVRDLGIYSAYLTSSIIIVGQLSMALSNVFFPMINRIENKKQIIEKVDKFMILLFFPIMISMATISFIVLKLFGSQYEINWMYIGLISFVSFLQILMSFYGSIVSSSHELFLLSTKIYYFKLAFMVILYAIVMIINRLDLSSVLIILVLSNIYDVINAKYVFKKRLLTCNNLS